ncbi:MAG: flagellar basal body P-ring formation chaperone FlgA [Pseudomonadales bacterium]
MIIRSFLLVFSLLSSLISTPAFSAVDAEQIRATAADFLADHTLELTQQYGSAARVDYKIDNLDPRLSMADCPQALNAELKSFNRVGHINIKVSCQHKTPWSLYIPAQVNLYRPVVSVTTPVAKGSTLSTAILQLQEMDISKLRGTYFSDVKDVAGMQAKRPLQPDKPVLASHLERPILIKRGDAVLVTAHTGNLMVKMPGTALMDGHKGEQISIRNRQSKRVVEARVTAPGQASVIM